MPDIELRDLNRSIGTELFTDPESFLEDLSDDAANVVGGISDNVAIATIQTTAIRPEKHPIVTTTLYNPHPGGNSGINCTGLYTTVTIYNPLRPRHPRPIHPTFAANDI